MPAWFDDVVLLSGLIERMHILHHIEKAEDKLLFDG